MNLLLEEQGHKDESEKENRREMLGHILLNSYSMMSFNQTIATFQRLFLFF